MALAPDFGMAKAALKAQIGKAQSAPVNCAVGKGKDANAGYILVDHAKPAKALQTALSDKFADMKDVRRGTIAMDPADAKVLVFTLNKPASGLGPRLAKVLKTVGYGKIRFSYEDGSPEELAEEAEDGDGQAAVAPAGTPADTPAPAATAPADAAAVKLRLVELVKGLPAVIAADPSRKDALTALAREAQAALQGGDAATIAAKLDALAAATKGGGAPAGRQPAGHDPAAGAVAYGKSRLAWLAVRKKMAGDFDRLGAALADVFEIPELAGEIKATVQDRVEPVLAALDEGLADALDEAANATDPAARAEHVARARGLIADYQKFVASDPTLVELDDNPVVPMKLRATLNATLSTLSAAVR